MSPKRENSFLRTSVNTSVPGFGLTPFAQPRSRFGHGENVMCNGKPFGSVRMSGTRGRLAVVAESLARKPFHGAVAGLDYNLSDITSHFPFSPAADWESRWCAAFVYHCCTKAGFTIPVRHPPPVTCNFAGVAAWLQWAKLPGNRFYYSARNSDFAPRRGDLVVFDNVVSSGPHSHIGVVLSVRRESIVTAEGNVNNVSNVLVRMRDRRVRGYVRIPSGFAFR